MKKRVYEEPALEVIVMEMEDVICTSAADNNVDGGGMWDETVNTTFQ